MEKEWCHVTLISVTSSLWTRVGNNVIFIGSVAKYNIYRHQYLLGNQFVLIIGLVVVVGGGWWFMEAKRDDGILCEIDEYFH